MKLLIDGDVLAYHAVYSAEGNTIAGVVKKLKDLMESIFYACSPYNRAFEYTVYLTGKGNFRHEISDVYKATRPKEKPATLNLARQYLIDNYNAVVTDGQEADDGIAIEATKLGYDNVIIVSVDKDFKQLPCLFYNYRKDEWFKPDEIAAKYNFWKQVVMGDTVDNIKGLANWGQKKAEKLLDGLTTEEDMFKAVLSAYEGNVDELTKNARLVYLRRQEGEMWEPPTV